MTTLNTRQVQKLVQKLSPQQIQMIKLLELPTIQLEQRIKQEIEENPVLEELSELSDSENAEEVTTSTRLNIDDYVRSEEAPTYRLNANNYSKDDKYGTIPLSGGLSYSEYLEEQLNYKELDAKDLIIGKYIIGTLDSDGYLRRELISISDDIAFSMGVDASEVDIERILKIIHTFEPHGTGARSLQEALLLQLRYHPQTSDVRLAMKILEFHFADFAKKHFEKIKMRMGLDNDRFKKVVDVIVGLSPKPANLYTDTPQNEPTIQIIPDFIIDYSSGELELSLNRNNIPDIKVNKSYVKMLQDISHGGKSSKKGANKYGVADQPLPESEKGAVQFIKQKIDSARWFIMAIKQRNATLLLTMHAIMEFQNEYFYEGDETKLRPMILKDIAEKTGLDVSTISRVVNSKYVQTHFGIFSLKYFFSEAMQTSSGEEVSSREIKKILSDCVEDENKQQPLTDEALMLILQDKGYQIARRTVAKYREMLDIPVARLRKEL